MSNQEVVLQFLYCLDQQLPPPIVPPLGVDVTIMTPDSTFWTFKSGKWEPTIQPTLAGMFTVRRKDYSCFIEEKEIPLLEKYGTDIAAALQVALRSGIKGRNVLEALAVKIGNIMRFDLVIQPDSDPVLYGYTHDGRWMKVPSKDVVREFDTKLQSRFFNYYCMNYFSGDIEKLTESFLKFYNGR